MSYTEPQSSDKTTQAQVASDNWKKKKSKQVVMASHYHSLVSLSLNILNVFIIIYIEYIIYFILLNIFISLPVSLVCQ